MQKFVQWLERFKEYSSGKAIAIKNRIIDISQRSRTLLNDGQTILECSTRIGYLKARQLVLKNAELLSLTKSEKHALELYGDYLEFRELSHYHFTDDSPSVLAEYCDSMAMSYSYKPVLLIALASIMDANGGCSVDDLTAEIMRYYASRIEQGLIAERSNSVFAGVVMLEEAKKVVIQNPVKALIAADVITWNGKQKRIAFTPGYLPSSEAQVEMVRSVCIKRLDAYYQRIQDNKVVIDSTNVRTYFAELLEQVDNPQLRIKIQECFDFIYGLNKTENKGESEPCVVAIDDDDVRTQRRNSYVPERISEEMSERLVNL